MNQTASSRMRLKILVAVALVMSYGAVALQYWRIAAAHLETVRWSHEYDVVSKRYHTLIAELKKRKIAPPPPVIHGADD